VIQHELPLCVEINIPLEASPYGLYMAAHGSAWCPLTPPYLKGGA
jgi:hypothetical protein